MRAAPPPARALDVPTAADPDMAGARPPPPVAGDPYVVERRAGRKDLYTHGGGRHLDDLRRGGPLAASDRARERASDDGGEEGSTETRMGWEGAHERLLRIARAMREIRGKHIRLRSSGAPCPVFSSDRVTTGPLPSDELGEPQCPMVGPDSRIRRSSSRAKAQSTTPCNTCSRSCATASVYGDRLPRRRARIAPSPINPMKAPTATSSPTGDRTAALQPPAGCT
jgi:hypothetical protein